MASVDVSAGAVVLIEDGTMIIGAVSGYPSEMTPALRSPIEDRDGFLDAVVHSGESGVFGSQAEMVERFRPRRAHPIAPVPRRGLHPIPGRGARRVCST
jgi:hypothetical protein